MFKNHPKGLQVLFFTEMWERFSYYGMKAILFLFLVGSIERGAMGLDTKMAAAIYGLYTAMVYLLALPGGWIADRILGQRNSIFIGGCIIAAGHFSMAIPSDVTFFAGLILIVTGTGLLKPNVSAIVGELYPEGGAKRDAGFSIFYMGINVGAFVGPLVCGFLGETIDWHLGFSAAGIGMIFGLIQYKMGYKHLGNIGLPKVQTDTELKKEKNNLYKGLGALVGLFLLFAILHNTGILTITLIGVTQVAGTVIVSIAVLYFGYIIFFGGLDSDEKKRVIVIFLLFIGAALFWSGFEQAGSSMNLFAERLTDREIFGALAPASWLQSINPLFIVIFAPLIGSLWVFLNNRQPSIPAKFGLGLLLLGVGFLVMAWAASYASEDYLVSPAWLVVTYFFHTIGELCLSPVGLSSVTKLSPKRFVGQMMGIWFMGSALGNLIAGLLAGQFDTLPLPDLFSSIFMFTAGAGVLFLLFTIPIKKLIGNIK